MDEFEFIRERLAPLARRASGARALTDDAATLDLPPDHELIITADALVGGVHFLEDDDPGAIHAGDPVEMEIDWERRHKHMRMHSCLHLLCAVVTGDVTGGQIGDGDGRLDFDIADAGALDKDELTARLNALVAADHPVQTRWITDAELEGILYMREEEKLARDVYLTLYEAWGVPIFQNIARSEATHMEAVNTLIDRYGLADPAAAEVGVFTDPTLQGLYDQLVADALLVQTVLGHLVAEE